MLTSMSAETVVIGGGTAGCVVAARLAEAGEDVVLLEAGPDYGPLASGAWPDDLLDAMSLPTSHDWGYQGAGSGGQPLTFDRAKVMGGCSSHNGCTQSVGWSGDYDRWAAAGSPGWDAASMRTFRDRAAEMLQLRTYADDEVQPFQAAFLELCGRHGLSRADDLLDLDAGVGAGCGPVNIVEGVRRNTSIAYLDKLRGLANLTILDQATAHRVLLNHGRVVGVEVVRGGVLQRLSCTRVVVSAGAYGTPEILLRSGIGPASELRNLGIDALVDLAGVGANLHDHPAVQLRFEASSDLAAQLGAFARSGRPLPEEQALAKLKSPYADGPYDLHCYPWIEPDPASKSGWRVVIPVAQLRPRSRGRVRLVPSAVDSLAEIDNAFLSDPEGADLGSLEFGLSWLEEVLRDEAFASLLGSMIDAPPASPEKRRTWIRQTHEHYWHPAGTAAMGPESDAASVVDHQGRVHGTEGLHVCDASVFPDIPRATPALPVVMVAEKLSVDLGA